RLASSSPSSTANASSVSLVSCRQTTSGRRSSNHGSSLGTRCLTELTFQLATRTPRHVSAAAAGTGHRSPSAALEPGRPALQRSGDTLTEVLALAQPLLLGRLPLHRGFDALEQAGAQRRANRADRERRAL